MDSLLPVHILLVAVLVIVAMPHAAANSDMKRLTTVGLNGTQWFCTDCYIVDNVKPTKKCVKDEDCVPPFICVHGGEDHNGQCGIPVKHSRQSHQIKTNGECMYTTGCQTGCAEYLYDPSYGYDWYCNYCCYAEKGTSGENS